MFVLLTRPSPRDSRTVVRQINYWKNKGPGCLGDYFLRPPPDFGMVPLELRPCPNDGSQVQCWRSSWGLQGLALHSALSNPALTSRKSGITSWKCSGLAVVCWSAGWRWAGLCCRSACGCIEGRHISFICTLPLSCFIYEQSLNIFVRYVDFCRIRVMNAMIMWSNNDFSFSFSLLGQGFED